MKLDDYKPEFEELPDYKLWKKNQRLRLHNKYLSGKIKVVKRKEKTMKKPKAKLNWDVIIPMTVLWAGFLLGATDYFGGEIKDAVASSIIAACLIMFAKDKIQWRTTR